MQSDDADILLSCCLCCQKATYATDLLAKEEHWRSTVPENALIAETLSLCLHRQHVAHQAQRVAGKRELICEYELQPLHCFTSSRPNTGAFSSYVAKVLHSHIVLIPCGLVFSMCSLPVKKHLPFTGMHAKVACMHAKVACMHTCT